MMYICLSNAPQFQKFFRFEVHKATRKTKVKWPAQVHGSITDVIITYVHIL